MHQLLDFFFISTKLVQREPAMENIPKACNAQSVLFAHYSIKLICVINLELLNCQLIKLDNIEPLFFILIQQSIIRTWKLKKTNNLSISNHGKNIKPSVLEKYQVPTFSIFMEECHKVKLKRVKNRLN